MSELYKDDGVLCVAPLRLAIALRRLLTIFATRYAQYGIVVKEKKA